jgi:hypothetical protein
MMEKNGKLWIVHDLEPLNKVTIQDARLPPIPEKFPVILYLTYLLETIIVHCIQTAGILLNLRQSHLSDPETYGLTTGCYEFSD